MVRPSGMITSSRGPQCYKVVQYIALSYPDLKGGRDGANQIAINDLGATFKEKFEGVHSLRQWSMLSPVLMVKQNPFCTGSE